MSKPPNSIIELLADFIMSGALETNPRDELLNEIGKMRVGLFNIAAIDYPALEKAMDEHLEKAPCGHENWHKLQRCNFRNSQASCTYA